MSIRWTGDLGKPWYEGKIVEFHAATDEHLVLYDDGEQRLHLLRQEAATNQLRWLTDPVEQPAAAKRAKSSAGNSRASGTTKRAAEKPVDVPPGWKVVRMSAPSKSYNVFHGPRGIKAFSLPGAWRAHEAKAGAPSKPQKVIAKKPARKAGAAASKAKASRAAPAPKAKPKAAPAPSKPQKVIAKKPARKAGAAASKAKASRAASAPKAKPQAAPAPKARARAATAKEQATANVKKALPSLQQLAASVAKLIKKGSAAKKSTSSKGAKPAKKAAAAAKPKSKGTRAPTPGFELIGKRVSIRWTGDPGKPWYSGKIVEYNVSTEQHLVLYDDGDQKVHHLEREESVKQLKWL